jgi:hypothetical protein
MVVASYAVAVVLDAVVVVLDAVVADTVMDVAAVVANGIAWNHQACVNDRVGDGAETAVMASGYVGGDDRGNCGAAMATCAGA